MNRVSFLILANLGLAACSNDPPAVSPEPPAASLNVPPMPASAAASEAPPPVASSPPPAPTSEPVKDPGLLDGVTCHTNKDCKSPQFCMLESGKTTGMCKYPSRGRALVVEGIAHVAPLRTRALAVGEELAALREGAREEHASIAAFARTICELMALGAPSSLLTETQRALADEIRHTERTLDLLETLTGERPVLGALDAATAPLAREPRAFFRDVLHGGAIGETRAATEAEQRRQAASDPDLRAFYDMLVVDESRHAALAFKTLRWLLERDPALRTELDAAVIPPALRPLFAVALAA